MLVRLLYASRAAAPLTPAVLDSILEQSRAQQSAPRASPACCASATTCSSRCSKAVATRSAASTTRSCATTATPHVCILSFEEIRERRFGGWTMGQVNIAKVNPTLLLKYSERAELNPFSCSGQASMALLDELIATASVVSRGG